MRFVGISLMFLSFVAGAATGLSTARASEQDSKQSKERWRYTYHNDEWWYWLPSNRWVYWRENGWNEYDPRTYKYPGSLNSTAAIKTYSATNNQTAGSTDDRPFYGHSVSDWDNRNLQNNSETGPFYGRALPSEILGTWRARRAVRPYYGHAVSISGD